MLQAIKILLIMSISYSHLLTCSMPKVENRIAGPTFCKTTFYIINIIISLSDAFDASNNLKSNASGADSICIYLITS